jgi:RNA polymerase sigma factor (TIGR02999 family)
VSDVTRILAQIEQGDPQTAEKLLPLVYDELRKLAAAKLAHENPGQTLQATALVHEAYVRLVGDNNSPQWDNRGHFFAAAAEAMRRILVESARGKGRHKRGGDWQRVDLEQIKLPDVSPTDDLVAIDEALTKLEADDPQAAQLVKLRFFAGLSLTEAAEALGISRTSAYDQWAYARAWLRCEVAGDASKS